MTWTQSERLERMFSPAAGSYKKNVFSNQQGQEVSADKADKLQNFMLFQNIGK